MPYKTRLLSLVQKQRNNIERVAKIKPEIKHILQYAYPSKTLPVNKPKSRRLINRLSNNARFFLEDLYNKNVARKINKNYEGNTYSEQHIPNKQLDEIDKQVRYVVSKNSNINGNYFKKHPNDTIRLAVRQEEVQPNLYGKIYGTPTMLDKFTPNGQIETTLGSYPVKVYRDGYTVEDVYDFNSHQGAYKGSNSLYAKIRRFAGKYGHTDKDSNNSKIKFKIQRKVNHW